MTALQVRDVPPELYEHLQKTAKAAHRSMAQQIVELIERDREETLEQQELERLEREEQIRRMVREEIRREREAAARRPRLTPEEVAEREKLFERIRSRPPCTDPNATQQIVDFVRQGRDER